MIPRLGSMMPSGSLFFDVGMEGVIHGMEVWMIDLLHVGSCLLHRIEEVAFETVEVFDRQAHTGLLGDVGNHAVSFRGVFPFGVRWAITGKITEFLVIGAT